jgi:hypothetical protein
MLHLHKSAKAHSGVQPAIRPGNEHKGRGHQSGHVVRLGLGAPLRFLISFGRRNPMDSVPLAFRFSYAAVPATAVHQAKTFGVRSLFPEHVPGTQTDEDEGAGDREHKQTRTQAHRPHPMGGRNLAEPEV